MLPRSVRILETTAGLLSAGALVLGLVLAVLMFAAPAVVDGSGLSAAGGPQTGRIVVQLAAGAIGEVLHGRRRHFGARSRPLVAAAVIIGELIALRWSWWR